MDVLRLQQKNIYFVDGLEKIFAGKGDVQHTISESPRNYTS
jgi:hypothetical protein